MPARDRLFVLTGAPGTGKTTVIEGLADMGHAIAPEAGRGVIRDQAAIDGPALPWHDPALFAEAMLHWELRSYAAASGRDVAVFFDRGIPDTLGYLELCGISPPAHMWRAAQRFRYADRVFAFPFWSEIYRQDQERQQTPREAADTYVAVTATYRRCGYDVVEVPPDTIERRAAFILSKCLG